MRLMNEAEFSQHVEATLLQLEAAIDCCGVDVDIDNADGILTLTFTNGSKIILNRQAAVKQLWVAAREGGFHFNYDDAQQCWRNDKDGMELLTALNGYCTKQSGESIQLR